MANEYPHLRRRSFGADLPEWAKDAAHTDVDVTVGFTDRLRILLLGKFSMRVVAYTEHVIGRTSGESKFIAPRFHFRQRKRMGYVMAEEPPPPTPSVESEGEANG